MNNKQETNINDLIYILNLFNNLNITYWLDGGWGVDVLYGKQTRNHRDIDIDYDSKYNDLVLNTLLKEGYIIELNELPVRAELYSNTLGYIDIHPFDIDNNNIKQASPDGGYFEFKKEWFGKAIFNSNDCNLIVPCISLEGQFVFHSGYELRDKDIHDIEILNKIKENIK